MNWTEREPTSVCVERKWTADDMGIKQFSPTEFYVYHKEDGLVTNRTTLQAAKNIAQSYHNERSQAK